MAEIKVEAEAFSSFLSKVNLDGLVLDCVVDAEDGNLVSCGLDTARAIYFNVVGEAKVEEAGQFIIGNIQVFRQILSRFDGMVKITSSDKQLVVRQRRKIGRFEVTALKSVDSYQKASVVKVKKNKVVTPTLKLQYKTNNFIADASQLREITGDADLLGEHTYIFVVEKKMVKVVVERGKNSFTTKLDTSKSDLKKGMSVMFGHGIKEIFKTVEGRVKIYLEKNPPMLIRFGDGLRSYYLLMTKEE